MAGPFDLEWLQLRGRYDGPARAAALEARLRADLPPEPRLVDLACGTAANLRHLAPRLGGRQRWLLVDHDADLLAAADRELATWAPAHGFSWTGAVLAGAGFEAQVTTRRLDLARDLGACLDAVDAVVSSAFLDLAGAPWIDQLVARVVDRRVLLHVALTADGRIELAPEDRDDAAVLALFLRHQRREKGLGTALGAAAIDHLARGLDAAGRPVEEAPSDWELGPADGVLQRVLVTGIARAADEVSPGAAADWRQRRLALLDRGAARMRIGHRDLYAGAPVA